RIRQGEPERHHVLRAKPWVDRHHVAPRHEEQTRARYEDDREASLANYETAEDAQLHARRSRARRHSLERSAKIGPHGLQNRADTGPQRPRSWDAEAEDDEPRVEREAAPSWHAFGQPDYDRAHRSQAKRNAARRGGRRKHDAFREELCGEAAGRRAQ